MVWAMRNLGLVLLGLMIMFTGAAVTMSMDSWTEQLKLNNTRVAAMDVCHVQLADMVGRVMPK